MRNSNRKWPAVIFVALCSVAAYAIAVATIAYNGLPAIIRFHLGIIVPADSGPKTSILFVPVFNVIICIMSYMQYLRAARSYAPLIENLSLGLALSSSILLVVAEKTIIAAAEDWICAARLCRCDARPTCSDLHAHCRNRNRNSKRLIIQATARKGLSLVRTSKAFVSGCLTRTNLLYYHG